MIEIDNYRIKRYNNYNLEVTRLDSTGKEKRLGYHSTITSAVRSIIKYKSEELSESLTLQEFLIEYDRISKETLAVLDKVSEVI